jgi:hypothetical protein
MGREKCANFRVLTELGLAASFALTVAQISSRLAGVTQHSLDLLAAGDSESLDRGVRGIARLDANEAIGARSDTPPLNFCRPRPRGVPMACIDPPPPFESTPASTPTPFESPIDWA